MNNAVRGTDLRAFDVGEARFSCCSLKGNFKVEIAVTVFGNLDRSVTLAV